MTDGRTVYYLWTVWSPDGNERDEEVFATEAQADQYRDEQRPGWNVFRYSNLELYGWHYDSFPTGVERVTTGWCGMRVPRVRATIIRHRVTCPTCREKAGIK